MTTGAAGTGDGLQQGSFVADLLPVTASPPEPARRVNFFKALFLFWLLPRRYGPHLAADSFGRALAAHGVSVVLAVVIPALPSAVALLPELGGVGTVHGLRVSLAELVLQLAAQSTTLPAPVASGVAVVFAVPLAQVVILLVATAAMPWCAGGDRASSVWKRSVKNVYWSTTILIPAAVIVGIGYQVDLSKISNDSVAIVIVLLLIGVPPVVILRMLVVGAGRYVGEPDGPAFAPRQPRCDECGYTLIKLPLETNCPECGLPVHDSLPGGPLTHLPRVKGERRQPTVWQQNELRAQGFLDLIRLQWVVLREPAFFKRVPVQSGLAAARHFWWGTYLLVAFTILGVLRLVYTAAPSEATWVLPLGGVALLAILVPFALQSAMMFTGCLWSQMRYGIRDYRISAIACYYAAPLMWPLLITVAAAVVAGLWLVEILPQADRSRVELWAGGVTFACLLGLTVGWLWFWVRRLAAGLRAVRYANV